MSISYDMAGLYGNTVALGRQNGRRYTEGTE
jgi:hypothetical protein